MRISFSININIVKVTNLLEWKHFMLAEFSTDTHTWFVDDTMFVIGLPSVDIFILFSTCNGKKKISIIGCHTSFGWLVFTCKVDVFSILILPCIEHHNFPWTLINFVAGLVTVPTVTAVGDAVFHPAVILVSFENKIFQRTFIELLI